MTDPHEPHATIRTAGPPKLGGVLGRYQLTAILGHGAMASVFRARDTGLGREVAIKVMNLAMAARADSAERFRREAQAVAAVKHPGIVEIFDFVAAQPAAGEPAYIVSELINGPTLRKFLDERRGRLLPECAALIALPLAEALHAAHSRGVIHRDIKPDNVMIERTAQTKRVVLADFGIAHVTGLETMTATGALIGSPSYMSPEQGRGDDVGPGADLFSLGILLYEMSTGHLPFTGREPLQVLASIGRGVYKRPLQVSPFVSPAFDEICCRCLKGQPSERYASAAALAEALRAYCADAGLATDGSDLRSFIEDPEAFETALRPRLADAGVARARKHARRGELAKALAELSRATAYVPGHPEAERLCATISSRRRWAKGAAVVGGVVALGAGAWTLVPLVSAQLSDWQAAAVTSGVRSEESRERRGPPVLATAPERVSLPEPQVAAPAEAPVVATSKLGRKGGKALLGKGARKRASAAPPDEVPAEPVAAPVVIAPPVVEPPPVPVPVAPPPDVAVVILASNAFCNPGIDRGAAQVSPAEATVKAGRHRIHCTLPTGAVWSTDIEIGPPPGGGPFTVQIARGPDQKPLIDWKRTSKPAPLPERAPATIPGPAD